MNCEANTRQQTNTHTIMTCVATAVFGFAVPAERYQYTEMVVTNCTCRENDLACKYCARCGRQNNLSVARVRMPEQVEGYPLIRLPFDKYIVVVHRVDTKHAVPLDLAVIEAARIEAEAKLFVAPNTLPFVVCEDTLHAERGNEGHRDTRWGCFGKVVIGLQLCPSKTFYDYTETLDTCACTTDKTMPFCSACGYRNVRTYWRTVKPAIVAALGESDYYTILHGFQLLTDSFNRISPDFLTGPTERCEPQDRVWYERPCVLALREVNVDRDPFDPIATQLEKERMLALFPDVTAEQFGVFGHTWARQIPKRHNN